MNNEKSSTPSTFDKILAMSMDSNSTKDEVSEDWSEKSSFEFDGSNRKLFANPDEIPEVSPKKYNAEEYSLAVFLDNPDEDLKWFTRMERLKVYHIEDRWAEYCNSITNGKHLVYDGEMAADNDQFLAFKCEYICRMTPQELKSKHPRKFAFLQIWQVAIPLNKKIE